MATSRLTLVALWRAVYEYNSSGRIPYVPYLRAPYYVWVGRHKKLTGQPPYRLPPTFFRNANLVMFPASLAPLPGPASPPPAPGLERGVSWLQL